MADFAAVIRRAVEGLSENTPEKRAKVYEKAKAAVMRQLQAMKPAPSDETIARQMEKLDAAAAQVEQEYAVSQDAAAQEPAIEAVVDEPAPLETAQVEQPAEPHADEHSDNAGQPFSESVEEAPTAHEVEDASSADQLQGEAANISASQDSDETAASEDHAPELDANSDSSAQYDQPENRGDLSTLSDQPAAVEEPAPWDEAPATETDAKNDFDAAEDVQETAEDTATDVEPAWQSEEADFAAGADFETAPQSPEVLDVDDVATGYDSAADQPAFFEQDTTASEDVAEASADILQVEADAPLSGDFPTADLGAVHESDPLLDSLPPGPDWRTAQAAATFDANTDYLPAQTSPSEEPDTKPADTTDEWSVLAPTDDFPVVDWEPEGSAAPIEDEVVEPTAPLIDDSIAPVTAEELDNAPPLNAPDTQSEELDAVVARLKNDAYATAKKSSGRTSKVAALLVAGLVVLGGIGFAAWQFSDALFPSSDGETVAEDSATDGDATNKGVDTAVDTQGETATDTQVDDVQKFTQRLMEDGSEIDEPLDPGQASGAEGKSVAEQNVAAAAGTDPSQPAATAIGHKMFLYEERLGQASPTVIEGTISWSEQQEGQDSGRPEPTIQANIEIPERQLSALVTFKRNTDSSLPASHIIEFVFSMPDDFEGGGIESVVRVAMKVSEQDQGQPLVAVPAKITNYFHMIALNALPEAVATNTELLKRDWMDIPIVYSNGRRALLTLEKGKDGEAIFDKVMAEWAKATAQ